MFLHYHGDTRQLAAREATALLQADRIEPDFGAIRIALHVHVRGLRTITGVEEKAVRANTEDGSYRAAFVVFAVDATCVVDGHITFASTADTP